jgi:hypothetical protein
MLKKLINLFGRKKKSKSNGSATDRSNERTKVRRTVSAEEMCGINPETMSKEAIRKRLAILYKRHNDAVSSLNPELRKEATFMLEAIVECRERYVDLTES